MLDHSSRLPSTLVFSSPCTALADSFTIHGPLFWMFFESTQKPNAMPFIHALPLTNRSFFLFIQFLLQFSIRIFNLIWKRYLPRMRVCVKEISRFSSHCSLFFFVCGMFLSSWRMVEVPSYSHLLPSSAFYFFHSRFAMMRLCVCFPLFILPICKANISHFFSLSLAIESGSSFSIRLSCFPFCCSMLSIRKMCWQWMQRWARLAVWTMRSKAMPS